MATLGVKRLNPYRGARAKRAENFFCPLKVARLTLRVTARLREMIAIRFFASETEFGLLPT